MTAPSFHTRQWSGFRFGLAVCMVVAVLGGLCHILLEIPRRREAAIEAAGLRLSSGWASMGQTPEIEMAGTSPGKSLVEAKSPREFTADQFRQGVPLLAQLGHPLAVNLSSTLLADIDGLQGLPNLRRLWLRDCTFLQNLNGLRGSALELLDASGCPALESIDGLAGQKSLQSLDLSNASKIISFTALRDLTELRTLHLSSTLFTDLALLERCTKLQFLRMGDGGRLQNAEVLARLPALSYLEIKGCAGLRNLDFLKGRTAAAFMLLSDCADLEDIGALREMRDAPRLELSGCRSLRSLEGLRGATHLPGLSLEGTALQSLEPLAGASGLQGLTFQNDRELRSVDGLRDLPELKSLQLQGCSALRDLDGCQRLPQLAAVDLRGCVALTQVRALRDCPLLTKLDLTGLPGRQLLPGLAEVTTLQKLDLSRCKELEDLTGLEQLTALRSLKLTGCKSLRQIEALRELPALEEVELAGCPIRDGSILWSLRTRIRRVILDDRQQRALEKYRQEEKLRAPPR